VSCFAKGLTDKETSAVLGISVPTFRKHFLHLRKERALARLRVEMGLNAKLFEQAMAGNVSANDKLMKRLDKADQRAMSQRISAAQKPAPVGKKEAQRKAAHDAEGLYAVRTFNPQVN
jgi:hypothetical protein